MVGIAHKHTRNGRTTVYHFFDLFAPMNIQINNLKKAFGEKIAVDIPNFEIHDGDILGLVGNNGAGKTTLFRLLLDLLRADEGRVLLTFGHTDPHQEPASETPVDGTPAAEVFTVDPSQSEDWKQHTGAYIDEGFLIDFLTPEEYFEFIAKVNHINKERLSTFLASLSKFMNGEILGQKKLIRDFSAGNKQKIGIISALIAQPKLLILDEPFNFLDPSSQNFLKRLLLNYHQTTGATILVSSHNLQHTVEISNRVALMESGSIIKDLPNIHGQAEKELEDYFNGTQEASE